MFMKKTTLLSLATAAAVVATSAGTYAAWDNLDVTKNTTVKFSKPVEVTLSELTFDVTDTLGSDRSASEQFTINVTDTETRASTLTITPTISGSGITLDDFDIELTDDTLSHNSASPSGSASAGFVDSDFNHNGDNTYTVKITPKEASKSKFTNSTDVSISVKASLS